MYVCIYCTNHYISYVIVTVQVLINKWKSKFKTKQ